jgi:hypothetical protein
MADHTLVIAAAGKPPERRPQEFGEVHSLDAVYAAPGLPGIVIVIEEAGEGGLWRHTVEWYVQK